MIRWIERHTLFLRVLRPLVGGLESVLGRGHDKGGDDGDGRIYLVADCGSGVAVDLEPPQVRLIAVGVTIC